MSDAAAGAVLTVRHLRQRALAPSFMLLLLFVAVLSRDHAAAVSFQLQPVATVQVSSSTPFVPGCAGERPMDRLYVDSAVEPHLAINPRDPDHLVAVWQQDRFGNGGARGILAAVSRDGGHTWQQSAAPFSRCSGGDYERASDPWVTFAPDGVVYQMALVVRDATSRRRTTAMLVTRSTDGGDTWSDAIRLIEGREPEAFNDKNAITADPYDARYVYAVWDQVRVRPGAINNGGLSAATTAPVLFSRTTDGGQTWEPPRVIYDGGGNTVGNIITVLPDGTLVNIFAYHFGDDENPSSSIAVIRSTDKGETWSPPVEVSALTYVEVQDAGGNHRIRTGGVLPAIAVDRHNGRLYAAWGQPGPLSTRPDTDIVVTWSDDGGSTWSAPVEVSNRRTDAGPGSAFVPALAVLDGGGVGVSWYDNRPAVPTAGSVPAMMHLSLCTAACDVSGSWRDVFSVGPFDYLGAPQAGGYFVGDYSGLVAAGDRFIMLFGAAALPEGAPGAAVYASVVPVP